MFKMKPGVFQFGRQHPSAFQQQFRFRPDQSCAHFEHPGRRRQSESATHQPSKRIHEMRIRNRPRRGNIVHPLQLRMTKEPFYRPANIFHIHPAIHLPTASLPPAQSPIDQTPVGYEYAAFPQGNRGSQRDLTGERGPLAKEGFLPALAYLHRKTATWFSGIFILRPVLRMPIDGGRRRVDPKLGRALSPRGSPAR